MSIRALSSVTPRSPLRTIDSTAHVWMGKDGQGLANRLRVSRCITEGLPFDLQSAEDEIATIRRQLMQQRVNHAQAGEPQRSVIMRLGAIKGPPHCVV